MSCEKSFGRIVRLVVLVGVCCVAARASADDVFFSVTGVTQGLIAGEVTQKGVEGKFRALAFNYEIKAPTAISATAGVSVGKTQLGLFRIKRESGRGSTQLFHAMVNSEPLKEIRVDIYRVAPTGVLALIQSIRLLNAMMVSYERVGTPVSEQGTPVKSTEVLEFLTRTVEVIDVEKNVSSSFSVF